ncbi:MAG: EAL domain-containing protein [Pseudomonadota bacterium]
MSWKEVLNGSDTPGLTDAPSYLKTATEAANVALWSTCPETGETWYSPTWFTILGYEPNAFEPSFDAFMERMHPDDRAPTLSAFKDLLKGRSETYTADFRLRSADGSWRWIGASGGIVSRGDDKPWAVYGMQLDITRRKEAEAALAKAATDAEENRQRLARLAENSPVALFEFRINAEGHVALPYVTTGVNEILGVPACDVEEDAVSIFRNIFEEDMVQMGPTMEESRAQLTPFRMRYRVHRPDVVSGFVWVQAHSMPRREPDGSTVWFGSVYDATEEVEREAMLAEARDAMKHLALHDGLTGLPNRRRFDELLKERSDLPKDRGPAAVLVRIDLDRFKFVNDTLGHPAGDAVLIHVAELLRRVLGPGDVASRVGGDEFCILMGAGRSIADAEAVVRALQDHLKVPFSFDGRVCRFGASFGIASSEQASISNGDLMSFTDAALYQAKAAGRGRLEVFSKGLHDKILANRRLAAEIEAALDTRQFEPFFQPQVSAQTGLLSGMEVLARWRRSDGSILTPDRFMPIAEQIRAVPLIDRMMVERTIEIVDMWGENGLTPPKISFNLSAGRLREPAIVDAVRALQERGIQVAFELLESILLEEEDHVVQFNLDLARDAGIHIEVDDFGTGHASILGLLQVSPDVLKIDRRLTEDVVDVARARELLASIIGIARSLGIRTIAEGVETEAQAAILRDLGCDQFQGFLFSRPLDADGLFAWAASQGLVAQDNPRQRQG